LRNKTFEVDDYSLYAQKIPKRYEITQRVKELSDGSIVLTEGALYPTLHKLEAEGLLKTERVLIGKRVRKYYVLTTLGKSQAKERVTEFVDFIRTMSTVLQVQMS
jgi:DNA-binding PadR family transcriptional regulator